jgi:hypothetical protein
MRALLLILCGAFAALPALGFRAPPKPTPPEPAVGDFTSSNYAVTFRAPEHAFFCPLPDGWEGSDHGTVVFLERPSACYGAGYPSSGRGFEPRAAPRVEVFYAYYFDDIPRDPEPPCRDLGKATLFGKPVALCERDKDGLAVVTAKGIYTGESPSELSMSLVTKVGETARFLPVFSAMLASAHPCRATWEAYDTKGHKRKTGRIGHGPQCPAGQWY